MTKLAFSVLAHDPSEKASQASAGSLTYAIASLSELWDDPDVDVERHTIKKGGCKLAIHQIQLASDDENSGAEPTGEKSYSLRLTGNREEVSERRIALVRYLKSFQFESLYVTLDEVSAEIACELYPLLYNVENQLYSDN